MKIANKLQNTANMDKITSNRVLTAWSKSIVLDPDRSGFESWSCLWEVLGSGQVAFSEHVSSSPFEITLIWELKEMFVKYFLQF